MSTPHPPTTAESDLDAARPSDLELLGRHRRGDPEAFDRLVRRWEGPTFRIACRVLGDPGAAEEVRQEVFLRLWRSPDAVRHGDRFAGWLRRATVNAALTAARARRRRHRAPRPRRRLLADRAEPPPDPTADRAERVDEADRLREALATLAPSDRALLALRFEEDLTFREIAEATGRPASTVKSRLSTLVDRLRDQLGGPDPDA